jgi:hypothetical protein
VVRTFSRAEWSAARDAWRDGGYDADTWYRVRYAAACRGMLYPPMGGRGDGCNDPRPSQRAIVYRALDSTPALLFAVIGRSSSWSGVCRDLIRASAEARAESDAEELREDRDAEARRRRDRSAAPRSIGEILRGIGS